MKQSLSYYMTILIVKLTGIKKDFSQDPIDYEKIRKQDIHQPKSKFFKALKRNQFQILNSTITEVKKNEKPQKLLLFFHGGAFISGPSKLHWDTVKTIVQQTEYAVWMCDYPKAPEHKITEISKNIDAIYNRALGKYQASEIVLIGDSAGGTLATTLVQRLVKNGLELPEQIILISPVMDASMSNPEIEKVDLIDPMLSKKGVLSAKTMCAEQNGLKHKMMSPLFGSFHNFPKTMFFMAENDITYPDQKLAIEKIQKTKADLEVVIGKNMPHIWPFLPVMKEAKVALNKIIAKLNT